MAPSAALHDETRRAFFREFGRQAVTAVGQAAAMAEVVNRTAGGAAAGLLGLGRTAAPDDAGVVRSDRGRSAVVTAASPSPVSPATDDRFRSPYRLAGDTLILLDQRGIPDRLDEVSAKRGADVAYYLRLGVARGGPLMAQAAAYGLALTAAERSAQTLEAMSAELRRTREALAASRLSSRLPAWAMERMAAATAGLEGSTPGHEVAARLRAEADAIATELQVAHAAIARSLAARLEALLPASEDRPLRVLLHGDQGALFGGLVGTGTTALAQIRDSGRALEIYVTEARPSLAGARLASWELRQAGLAHRIVPDAAVAWLFAREPIDVVLVAAEWIAANGDTAALVGARAIAQLAAAAADRPQVFVSAAGATIDEATPSGTEMPEELVSAAELVAYLADVPIRASDALGPAADVIPAELITVTVTEAS